MMSVMGDLNDRLKRLYEDKLFRPLKIDSSTGKVGHDAVQGKKFPTYPYLGSRFGGGSKILFVGLDIGCDEERNGVQGFSDRRKAIEDKSLADHNPHIAGTYFIAMYLLRDCLASMRNSWSRLAVSTETYQALLKSGADLPDDNPLSYVALTNYYKFVTEERSKRSGSSDRRYLDKSTKCIEQHFFRKEVRILEPNIIVFQSKAFENLKFQQLAEGLAPAVYVAPHPSARFKGARAPSIMVDALKKRPSA